MMTSKHAQVLVKNNEAKHSEDESLIHWDDNATLPRKGVRIPCEENLVNALYQIRGALPRLSKVVLTADRSWCHRAGYWRQKAPVDVNKRGVSPHNLTAGFESRPCITGSHSISQ